jgi:hypothetical protein
VVDEDISSVFHLLDCFFRSSAGLFAGLGGPLHSGGDFLVVNVSVFRRRRHAFVVQRPRKPDKKAEQPPQAGA